MIVDPHSLLTLQGDRAERKMQDDCVLKVSAEKQEGTNVMWAGNREKEKKEGFYVQVQGSHHDDAAAGAADGVLVGAKGAGLCVSVIVSS